MKHYKEVISIKNARIKQLLGEHEKLLEKVQAIKKFGHVEVRRISLKYDSQEIELQKNNRMLDESRVEIEALKGDIGCLMKETEMIKRRMLNVSRDKEKVGDECDVLRTQIRLKEIDEGV